MYLSETIQQQIYNKCCTGEPTNINILQADFSLVYIGRV
jgi:hypothetical protein